MRWFVLLAVLGGILWTANWSYHHVDNAILITDFWKAERSPSEWGLVNFKDNQPVIYEYVGTKGFWNIFKGLWPVWALFTLIFLILTPLSMFIYNGLNNRQITAAKEAQAEAIERAEKKIQEARNYEKKTKEWAEEKINSAYEEQEKRIRAELESESQNLHQFKSELLKREQTIRAKEVAAMRIQKEAEQKVAEIQRQYLEELNRFETEANELRKAKEYAQNGFQRLKRKIELQTPTTERDK
ncbi:hypothetical protein P0F40_003386 [Vibrio metschnikovii]|nr:hypothetical protein [Vibrio metschnikovii]EKO3726182.1 hypothetical protein [Vibrio metschnikovii]EKO3881596.1 hypothetical protein [Vibrio metschnikovii]EKO3940761.1 hypothetical protein [Vibrio metschnikovii]